MNPGYYLKKIKDVKPEDYMSAFPMLAGLFLSVFFRARYKEAWAVSERRDEARDNGYHFYRYMRKEHKEQPCVYAIDRHCRDYRKIKKLGGEVVQYGSVRHWIVYFSAKWLISSQSFKPNGYMGTLIERMHLFRPDHVFLQHGITKDHAEFLLASHRNVKYFIAGAEPEYEFMRRDFGYPEGTMQYTGFARFDALHHCKTVKNRILVMPTWRKWLRLKSETHLDAGMDMDSSEYLLRWRELLAGDAMRKLISEKNLELILYPHPNMKGIMDPAKMVCEGIRIADPEKDDLQGLLKSSSALITDYSSVFFDMAYMKKPIIFYQFDEDKYRKYHYQQGWFDYHKTEFGKSCRTSDEAIRLLESMADDNYAVSEGFLKEHEVVFPLYDADNCRRIYELLRDRG